MTYREKYFELKKLNNEYLTHNVIKSILMDDGGFNNFLYLLNNFDKEIANPGRLSNIIDRIKKGEPYQYVLGYAFFINSNYVVTPDVLIPRQETEQLAVSTMMIIKKMFNVNENIRILDLGTGSGILAIYLKENFKNAIVSGFDISEKSLEIARKNAKIHDVSVDFVKKDMCDSINENVDVIICNPPYIESEKTVDPQTLKYEPHLALFAQPKCKFYEAVFKYINYSNEKLLMAFEVGEDMEDELTKILESEYPGIGYKFEKDIYGKTRFLYIIRNEETKKYDC